jgi:hypothetical protein
MPEWLELKTVELRDWIASLKGDELPIFQLRAPQLKGENLEWHSVPKPFMQDYMERRRPDSGILELRFEQKDGYLDSSLASHLFEIARSEDERHVQPAREIDSEVVYAEFETELTDLGMRVIGTGGRITVNRAQETSVEKPKTRAFNADIVIRRRTASIVSRWRDSDDVAQSILRRIDRFAQTSIESLFVQFGYLELSKYELQNWMRSAVLISFAALAVDNKAKWTSTIAEPVTTTENLELMDGLGSFAE